uniref:Uncharacterized protein n=1 Tax=Schistocephalus solidus TaxID=70667 RepID=A0A0X3P9L9_SCHSO
MCVENELEPEISDYRSLGDHPSSEVHRLCLKVDSPHSFRQNRRVLSAYSMLRASKKLFQVFCPVQMQVSLWGMSWQFDTKDGSWPESLADFGYPGGNFVVAFEAP